QLSKPTFASHGRQFSGRLKPAKGRGAMRKAMRGASEKTEKKQISRAKPALGMTALGAVAIAAVVTAVVVGLGARAQSAKGEVTVIAPGGIRAAMEQLIPGFEIKTGYEVKATFGSG